MKLVSVSILLRFWLSNLSGAVFSYWRVHLAHGISTGFG
ncbi:unnamed protein product [Rhodiola kirilowii]